MTVAEAVTVDRVEGGPWSQNCYLVFSPDGDAVVIDPGGSAAEICSRIEDHRLRLRAILATHGHHDHVAAAAEVAAAYPAPFGIHSADVRALRRVNLCRFVFHRLGPVAMPPIELDLAQPAELCFGGLRLTVIHTPGHTAGSVCLGAGEVLFTGDTLIPGDRESPRMPESAPTALAESVRLLASAFPADAAVYPGHGAASTLGEAVAAMLESPA